MSNNRFFFLPCSRQSNKRIYIRIPRLNNIAELQRGGNRLIVYDEVLLKKKKKIQGRNYAFTAELLKPATYFGLSKLSNISIGHSLERATRMILAIFKMINSPAHVTEITRASMTRGSII